MRRKEREISDINQIEEIIKKCDVIHVAYYDGVKPYIVPVNFGYMFSEGKLCLYFHGAKDGKKAELSKLEPTVAFEMYSDESLGGSGTEACRYTCYYKSVMGSGKIKIVDDIDEKIFAFERIMENLTGKNNYTYNEKALENTNVFKIEADEFTAKGNGR